jgi:hypothetical protein
MVSAYAQRIIWTIFGRLAAMAVIGPLVLVSAYELMKIGVHPVLVMLLVVSSGTLAWRKIQERLGVWYWPAR